MENQKKKIIYLVTQGEHGGAGQYVFDLATNLDQEEWQVFVATGESEKNWLFETIGKKQETRNKVNTIKTIHLKHVKRNLNFWYDLMSGFELYKLFKKIKPDVIHVNSSKVGATGSVIGKLFTKAKIIYTVHGLVLNEPTLKKWQFVYYWLAEKISGWFEDKLICVSEFDRKACLKYKIAKDNKLVTVYNGIREPDFLDKEIALGKLQAPNNNFQKNYNLQSTNHNFNIGFIGNLYENKGLPYLFEALKILATNYQLLATCYLLTNGGPEKERLEIKIKELELGNVVQFMNGENAKIYLKAFDIFVLPSIKEGLSYTLIEALYAGLPIVTTRVGGNPEIIEDNSNGLLVPPDNPKELAEAIYKIYSDESLRQKLISNTKQAAEKFSLEKMLGKTEKIYNE